MTGKYAVLRGLRASLTRDPFGGGAARVAGMEAAVAEATVDVAHLSPREIRDLTRDPGVAAVAPVMPTRLVTPLEATAGPAAAASWGVAAVKADLSAFDGNGVVPAVLDTGIDAAHPAFQGVTLVQEDFTGTGNGDGNGHGTHCAGTIFGRDVSGTRIGVARGVKKALIGKVLAADGGGQSDWIFQAIQWAVNQGARVISMSLGFDFPGLVKELTDGGWPVELATSAALEAYRGNLRMFDALMEVVRARTALDGGTVVVAAAGNESHREINKDFEIAASLPAAAEGVISVGALGQAVGGLTVPFFSNTLPEVSGPGVDIVSARPGGGLRALTGTSMATPHVAGIAVLWWQALRSEAVPLNARTVTARLMATARTAPLAPGVDIEDRGAGIVTAP